MAPLPIQSSQRAIKIFMKNLRSTNKLARQAGGKIDDMLPLSYKVPGGGIIKAEAGRDGTINLTHSTIMDFMYESKHSYEVTKRLKKPKYTGSLYTSKEGSITLSPGEKRFFGLIKEPDVAEIELKNNNELFTAVGKTWKKLKNIISGYKGYKEIKMDTFENFKKAAEKVLKGGYKS